MKNTTVSLPFLALVSTAIGGIAVASSTQEANRSTPAEMPALQASINGPRGIAFDPLGFLYIIEVGHGQILRLDIMRGVVRSIRLPPPFGDPGGETLLAEDNASNLYLANLRGDISKFDASTETFMTLQPGNRSAPIIFTSISADTFGGILATSLNQIVRWTPGDGTKVIAGAVRRAFAGDGGPAVEARFSGAMGVAVNANGDIYIADSGNCRIRLIDSKTRQINTIAGTGDCHSTGDKGPATKAGLSYPKTLLYDAGGNLYFTEDFRVRRIDKYGIISTYAGTGERGSSGDGGIANDANLDTPSGLAADKSGNLYISDFGANRIRRVDFLTHVITTVAGDGSSKRNEVVM